jgi:hypothetical protein
MAEASAPGPDVPQGPRRLAQLSVLAAALVCLLAFWWAGNLLHLPAERGYAASLIQEPGTGRVVGIVAAMVLFVGCAVLGQFIGGRWWAYAGPFAAAVGLSAWSARGGPSRYVYFHADSVGAGKTVFLQLMLEQLLLFVPVAAVWYLIATRTQRLIARAVGSPSPIEPGSRPETSGKLQAVATQTIIMALGVLLLCQSDIKRCALAAVFFAALAGTGIAEYWFKDEKAVPWYWVGPLAVGAIGYLMNYFTGSPDGMQTGFLTGAFASLARPVPLDYASAGMAGAIVGAWIASDRDAFHAAALVGVFGVGYFFLPDSIRHVHGTAPIRGQVDVDMATSPEPPRGR